ncbi:MAG: hypothetical protein ACREBC_35090 [Pyrinomonadaceae bacterium]
MAIIPVEKIYEGTRLNRVTLGVMHVRTPVTGTIKSMYLWVPAFTFGPAAFNIRLNGVAQFTGVHRFVFNDGDTLKSKTGLSIAVTRGDTIELDLEEVPQAGISVPVVLLIEIDDGVPIVDVIGIAASDETTVLTTGTAKVTIRMPYAFNLTAVRSNINTVSSSGLVTVDINENGVSILSTKLSIDAGEKTSETAAVPPVISDSALADDAEITIDIDAAGTGAKGLKVWLIGSRV